MMHSWELLAWWPVRAIVLGLGVLLGARVLLLFIRQPARRLVVGKSAAFAAILALPLSFVPGWLPITLERKVAPFPEAMVVTAPLARSEPAPRLVEEIPLEPLPLVERALDREVQVLGVEDVRALAQEPERLQPEPEPLPTPTTNPDFSWTTAYQWLAGAYGAVVVGLLVRLGLGQLTLWRWWGRAQSAPAAVEATYRTLAATMCPTAQLRVASALPAPVCFGICQPRILLPEPLAQWGDETTLRCIFAHELSHLQRRDPLTAWLLGVVRCLYFVCPWLGGIRHRVRLAQEYLADAAAVQVARTPADYAELLLNMSRPRTLPSGAVGVRGNTSDLYRRVTMLLHNAGAVEQRCSRRWLFGIGGGLTALAIGIGGLSVQPIAVTAAPEKQEKEDATSKQIESLKKAIDKLTKDLGPDNETVKLLEASLRQLQEAAPAKAAPTPIPVPMEVPLGAPPAPPALPPAPPPGAPPVAPPPLPPAPVFPPIVIGGNPEDLQRDIQRMQDMMRKQLEEMMRLSRARAGIGGGGGGLVFPQPGGGFGGFSVPAQSQGRLGIRIERPTDALVSQLDLPNGKGLVCTDVPADSVAGKAGIKPHDILLEVDGKSVSSDGNEFITALQQIKADQAVDIVVLRKGRKETIKGVKLPEAKVAEQPRFQPFQPPQPFPVPIPVPMFNPPLPGGNNIVIQGGVGETFRVERVDDAFTIFMTKNGAKLTMTGAKEEGGAKAESIELEVGGKTTKFDSVDKLPKEYQEMAQRALKSIR